MVRLRDMLKMLLAVCFVFVSSFVVRADEAKLTSVQISALLPEIVVHSDAIRQTFSASGSTVHTNRGRDSLGRWMVRDDQYCSQWPPSDNWVCYDVLLQSGDPEMIIWVDEQGGWLANEIVRKD